MEVREPSAKYLARSALKQTEVGEIPRDWEARQIHEFALLKTGPFGTLLKASEYSGGEGVPLISVGEIRDGFIRISDETPLVPDAVVQRLPQYVLRRGDIVFGRKGGVERSAPIRQEHEGCFLGSDGICVRPMEGNHPEYLASQFQSHRVQEWLLQHSSGTTMPSLNQEILRRVLIPLPPTSAEQQAIADALGDADALIESLEHLLAKKRQIKQGTMQALLSGQQRLPGSEGVWRAFRVAEIADVKTGPFGSALHERDYVSVGTPIITVEHLGELGITYQNLPRVCETDCRRLQAYSLEIGDIVFSRVGSVDRNALVREAENGWLFSGRLLRLRPNRHCVFPAFLSYQFHTDWFRTSVTSVAVGQTMASLNTQILNGLEVVLPSVEEQTAIATVLADMDAEIAALEARLAKARALKQGMMQTLLTGRIRLV